MATIVTGDDVSIPTTLKKNNATFTINGGATVRAAIVTQDRETVLVAATAVNLSASGTDLANSLIIVEFTSVQTAAIATAYSDSSVYRKALVEIEVDDTTVTTFFFNADVVKGNVN